MHCFMPEPKLNEFRVSIIKGHSKDIKSFAKVKGYLDTRDLLLVSEVQYIAIESDIFPNITTLYKACLIRMY